MIADIIIRLRDELQKSFDELNPWFEVDVKLLYYKPKNEGWTIAKILEHISLTNYYLMILIRKGTVKAIQKAERMDFSHELSNYELNWNALHKIGEHGAFKWSRPEHMEPTGTIELNEIKIKLQNQLDENLGYLDQLKNGEGILYKTTMTVANLGKLDVYHYVYFLSQHIGRHLEQMQKINKEFYNRNNS